MDDKKELKKLLKEIYSSLTAEQKKKVKACKTTEELLNFISEEKIELPDEIFDAISGGLIFLNAEADAFQSGLQWEVINDTTGNVDGRFSDVWDANKFALDTGQSLEITRDFSKVQEIRDNYKKAQEGGC